MTKLSTLLDITRGQKTGTWTRKTKTGPTETKIMRKEQFLQFCIYSRGKTENAVIIIVDTGKIFESIFF